MIDGSKKQKQKERKKGSKGEEKRDADRVVDEMNQEEYVLLLNEEFEVRAGTNV